MEPKFFEFKFRWPDDPNLATASWIQELSAEAVPLTSPCPVCGARQMAFRGLGVAAGVGGVEWPDIIGSMSMGPQFVVSERVVQGLALLNAKGFSTYPVRIASTRPGSRLPTQRQDYFYLSIAGKIAVDWKLSRLDEPCPICGAPRRPQIRQPERIIPIEDSWDGSDLFYGSPYGGPYCTLRVLLLARRDRWTNFCFHPIDAARDEKNCEQGIDYLGEQWPPKWYADNPNAGRTLEEWLNEYYIEADSRQAFDRIAAARRALDALGTEALPPLIERFEKGSLRAAQAICSIAQRGTAVPSEILDRAQQMVWAEDVKYNPHLFERDADGRLRYKKLT